MAQPELFLSFLEQEITELHNSLKDEFISVIQTLSPGTSNGINNTPAAITITPSDAAPRILDRREVSGSDRNSATFEDSKQDACSKAPAEQRASVPISAILSEANGDSSPKVTKCLSFNFQPESKNGLTASPPAWDMVLPSCSDASLQVVEQKSAPRLSFNISAEDTVVTHFACDDSDGEDFTNVDSMYGNRRTSCEKEVPEKEGLAMLAHKNTQRMKSYVGGGRATQKGLQLFNVHDLLQLNDDEDDDESIHGENTISRIHSNSNHAKATEDEDTYSSDLPLVRFLMLCPQSGKRSAWDFLCLVFAGYDFVTVPISLMEPSEWAWEYSIAWCIRIFWTIDIFVSFFTGYIKRSGGMELRFRQVALHYMETWFLFDLFVVLGCWAEYIVDTVVVMKTGVWKSVRTLRVLRGFRLMRVLQVLLRYSHAGERVITERVIITLGIAKVMLCIGCFMHIVSCGWYGVAIKDYDTNWVDVNELRDSSLGHRYAASFHWTITMFTGSNVYFPTNYLELTYSLLAHCCAFFISMSAVSLVTTSMTRLHMLGAKTTQQLWLLRRYLLQHHIPNRLSTRILRNSNFIVEQQKNNISEAQIELLKEISLPLRMELRYEVYANQIRLHSFFDFYSKKNPLAMHLICFHCLSEMRLSKGDILFSEHEEPKDPCMYFFRTGELGFYLGTDMLCKVNKGQWASEATMWTVWIHQGTLKALEDCDLVCMNTESFREFAQRFRTQYFYPAYYAEAYVRKLNDLFLKTSQTRMSKPDASSTIVDIDCCFREGLLSVNSEQCAKETFPELQQERRQQSMYRRSNSQGTLARAHSRLQSVFNGDTDSMRRSTVATVSKKMSFAADASVNRATLCTDAAHMIDRMEARHVSGTVSSRSSTTITAAASRNMNQRASKASSFQIGHTRSDRSNDGNGNGNGNGILKTSIHSSHDAPPRLS